MAPRPGFVQSARSSRLECLELGEMRRAAFKDGVNEEMHVEVHNQVSRDHRVALPFCPSNYL